MGNQQLKPLLTAMRALLKERGLKVPEKVLGNFLREVDRVAPWFVSTGSLSKGSWNKLGIDLKNENEKGKLRAGTWPLYKMIRACIEDSKCQEKVKEGQRVLAEHQDSLSEAEKEKSAKRERKIKKENDRIKDKKQEGERKNLYPVLDEFKSLRIEGSSSEGASSESEGDDNSSSSFENTILNPEEQTELEEAAARYEAQKCRPDPYAPAVVPTAPLLEGIIKMSDEQRKKGGKGFTSFIPSKEIRKIRVSFPGWEDANQTRQHSQLDLKQLKALAESVQTYGVNASFTQALIERLAVSAMTPDDWYNTVKACLTMGQYLDWKSIFQDLCAMQARQNIAQGHPQWNHDMLTGQGQWTANQTVYPAEVYEQINKAAIKAWKSLPNKGQVTGNLTKIIQGNNEPFSDFVARMMEAAGRIFGDPDTALPLIEQLIFEQCTRECRNAITPWKSKGLNAWMKACREIGGPLSNAGLAAAILAAQRATNMKCFKCGKLGHIQRQCRSGNSNAPPQKAPGMCPRCNKGKHWANECRSVRDDKGRLLTDQPKNGQRGPRPQGPQMYGAINIQNSPQRPSLQKRSPH